MKNRSKQKSDSYDREDWFDITKEELTELFKIESDPAGLTKFLLLITAALLTPVTYIGALLGFVRSYKRFLAPMDIDPGFHPLRPVSRVAMLVCAVLIWIVILLVIGALILFIPKAWLRSGVFFAYVGINLFLSVLVFLLFRQWRNGIRMLLEEKQVFGSARFARKDDLARYASLNSEGFYNNEGFYIGRGFPKSDFVFPDRGHLLTCAGTRSGKFVNIIAPNLLGVGDYRGSWVIIDPKGEVAAVTARYQRESGKKVIILNPWGLLAERLGPGDKYNPLDILSDSTNPNLVDDATMIAEMLVPLQPDAKETFFHDNARSVIAGLLLHMATSLEKKDVTLKTLWKWARLPKDDFRKLLEQMIVSKHKLLGFVVEQSAYEIEKLMQAGDRTWGSIIATVLQCTDFIKSPALQAAMESGYDPQELSDGNTALYVIIPADKLQSHSRWLRLVVTTTMRAVVRNPNKRVCFLLDEFPALGYLPEIEIGLGSYAGYEITIWPIVQSLIQLNSIYKTNWESFIGNSAVRMFFGINDNFSADYISSAIGKTTTVKVERNLFGITKVSSTARELVTSDELRRISGEYIFTFIGSAPIHYYRKLPYYEMLELGAFTNQKRFDDNPYFK